MIATFLAANPKGTHIHASFSGVSLCSHTGSVSLLSGSVQPYLPIEAEALLGEDLLGRLRGEELPCHGPRRRQTRPVVAPTPRPEGQSVIGLESHGAGTSLRYMRYGGGPVTEGIMNFG